MHDLKVKVQSAEWLCGSPCVYAATYFCRCPSVTSEQIPPWSSHFSTHCGPLQRLDPHLVLYVLCDICKKQLVCSRQHCAESVGLIKTETVNKGRSCLQLCNTPCTGQYQQQCRSYCGLTFDRLPMPSLFEPRVIYCVVNVQAYNCTSTFLSPSDIASRHM